MAHQIESMFFRGETPWHGLGNRVTDALSVKDAIKQAGLDWMVREQEIFLGHDAPIDNAPKFDASAHISPSGFDFSSKVARRHGHLITSHKAIVRATDGAMLGVVGKNYKPLQNSEAFGFFDPLVTSGLVSLETAGSLQQGKRIWVLARINDNSDLSIVGDDVIRKFIMLSNAHDGTLAVRAGFTPIRVVCANTMAMAHQNGASQLIRLKHSKSVVANLEALRDTINVANQSFEATAEQFRSLARKQINADDLRKYVKVVLGHEQTEDKDLSARASNQISEVINLFDFGRGSYMPGIRGTVWAAYNAVTEYLTHEAGSDGDKRYNSLWFGGNASRNQLALTKALELAAA